MKEKIIYIFWAIVFFLVGIATLTGFIDIMHLSLRDTMIVYMTASAAFIISYFLDGIQKWGWLLPALVLAGMAADISPAFNTFFHAQTNGVPIMGSIAMWFIIGFLLNHRRWWLLIPSYILIIAAIETAINTQVSTSVLYGAGKSTFLVAYSSGAGIMLMLALPFYVVYVSSKKSWWALIPAVGLSSIAVVVALESVIADTANSMESIYRGFLLLAFAIIFGILWLRRKTQSTSWAIYPAIALGALAIVSFILGNGWNALTDQDKAIFFAVASAASFIGYFVHGLKKWGWLFPALLCAVIALILSKPFGDMQDSPLVMVLVLASIAIPFYTGYGLNRKQVGLLITAIIATTVMLFIVMADSGADGGAWIFFAFALPFLVIYFLSGKNWWAFIPAGIFISLGLVPALDTLIPHEEYSAIPGVLSWDVFIWVLFLGFSVTFAVPWLRRKTQPTAWAMYPAVGFLALAVVSIITGERFQDLWLASVMFIIAGVFLMAVSVKQLQFIANQRPEIKA